MHDRLVSAAGLRGRVARLDAGDETSPELAGEDAWRYAARVFVGTIVHGDCVVFGLFD
jgi:hypothetical protein